MLTHAVVRVGTVNVSQPSPYVLAQDAIVDVDEPRCLWQLGTRLDEVLIHGSNHFGNRGGVRGSDATQSANRDMESVSSISLDSAVAILDSWLCKHSACVESCTPKDFAADDSSVTCVANLGNRVFSSATSRANWLRVFDAVANDCSKRSKTPANCLTRVSKLAKRRVKLSVNRDNASPETSETGVVFRWFMINRQSECARQAQVKGPPGLLASKSLPLPVCPASNDTTKLGFTFLPGDALQLRESVPETGPVVAW